MNGIHQLKAFCNYKNGRSILRHALGIEKMPNAPAIADKMIVICLDTESWVHDHRLTEIGLTALDATEAHPITTPGPHGENYLKLIYFYHYRLKPTAHLVNRKNAHSGDPEKNRFGVTKFVTFQEASNLLRNAFNWEVDPGNPHKGYCPIVFVGHAVRNDIDTLTQALGMSPTDFNTVVKTIDTQQLAREVGINTGNFQISLSKLTNLHDIEYRSGHTACNDAAYTIFNAVLMALRNELYISPTGTQQITNNTKSVQRIIDEVEDSSADITCQYGTTVFCDRCDGTDHLRRQCRMQYTCQRCKDAKRYQEMNSHQTAKCTWK